MNSLLSLALAIYLSLLISFTYVLLFALCIHERIVFRNRACHTMTVNLLTPLGAALLPV